MPTQRYNLRLEEVNLMLNTSDYDESALTALMPVLKESVVKIPGLRLTVYNRDVGYKLSAELKKTLRENMNFRILTPAMSGNVKLLTAEIRRQHVILTANNMMMYAATAARIKTVMLPDAGMLPSDRIDDCSISFPYRTLMKGDKNNIFLRRIQREIINALEEVIYEII